MNAAQREWIDKATYTELIHAIQTEPVDSDLFRPGTVEYLLNALKDKVARLIEQDALQYPELCGTLGKL